MANDPTYLGACGMEAREMRQKVYRQARENIGDELRWLRRKCSIQEREITELNRVIAGQRKQLAKFRR